MALVIICDRKTMKVKRRFDNGREADADWNMFTSMVAEDMVNHYAEDDKVNKAGGTPISTEKK